VSLEIRVGGVRRRVDLRRERDRYRGRIGRRSVEAEVVERGPFSLLIRLDGRSYEVTFDSEGTKFVLDLGHRHVAVEILDPLRSEEVSSRSGAKGGKRDIRAAMPGKVVAVKAKVGEQVAQGQGLMILEAMKMENEVPSPCSGTVISLGVAKGDTVETGSLLATVE
jgi:biotin carboxyl carrier protein